MADQGAQRPALPRRNLRVSNYEVLGKTKDGKSTIYKVYAVDESGAAVDLELRAFQELPVGELVEYAISHYKHERYGDTYTLYPPKEKLGTRVEKLEERVKALEERLEAAEGIQGGVSSDGSDIPF